MSQRHHPEKVRPDALEAASDIPCSHIGDGRHPDCRGERSELEPGKICVCLFSLFTSVKLEACGMNTWDMSVAAPWLRR